MAQPYTTGPVLVWVGVGVGYTPTFLGTAESFPRQQHRPKFGEVKNDLAGSQQPLDQHFQGSDAILSVTLTYWNDNVFQSLEKVPSSALTGTGNGAGVGTYSFLDLGTMMLAEGQAFPVWFVYPAARSHTAMASLPAGYRYPTCIFRGPWEAEGGTKELKRQAIFHAQPKWNASTGLFTVYDYDMSALPGTPPGTAIN